MKQIVHVVGARPNFMKLAPVFDALRNHHNIKQVVVHTGQHYDERMSEVFFRQLRIPTPDVNLGVGSGSHAVQTAQIMVRFEEWVVNERPDIVVVYGDVNSTVAVAIVCAKCGIRVAHVEAGLRSFDRSMPEEINRLLTDQVASVLFPPSQDGVENLLHEGISPGKIHLVGNVMIDSLVLLQPKIDSIWNTPTFDKWRKGRYALLTLHRPSNVDDLETLRKIFSGIKEISHWIPVVFPVHPRTRERLSAIQDLTASADLHMVEPLGYLEFLVYQRHASIVLTDSGGVQEETTYLQVPCLTLRENTERPITVSEGTNILVGHDIGRLHTEVGKILRGETKCGKIPALWDGKAGERIATILGEPE